MRDPKGNELKVVLLRVMEADEQGPVLLRVRRDHERVDLTDERNRTFMMVWAPADQVLGELRLSDIYDELEKIKALQAEMHQEKIELGRKVSTVEREVASLEDEIKLKTEALRALQKERDPDRLTVMVRERTAEQTAVLDAVIAKLRAELESLRRENVELKAAKRRLKEANERLKERG